MPKRFIYLLVGLFCIGVGGGEIWVKWHERAQAEQARLAHEAEVAEENRRHDERIQTLVDKAERILDEMPAFDFWPFDSDLWRVKQITVAAELKVTPDQLREELTTGLKEIATLAQEAGPQQRLRAGQAGDVAFALFRLPEAEQFYRQAGALADRDADRRDSLHWNEKVADVWHSAGHYDEERSQREMVATLRTAPGMADSSPYRAAAHLGMCFCLSGKIEDGIATVDKVLPRGSWQMTSKDPDILLAAAVRCYTFHEAHRMTECEAEAQLMFDESQRVLGEEDEHTVIALGRLVATLNATNRYAHAAGLAPSAVELSRKVYGEKHPLTAMFLRFAADTCAHNGDFATAESLAQQSLDIFEEIFPPETVEIAHAMALLGAIAEKTNRITKAQQFMRGALDIYLKRLGPKSNYALGCESRLAAMQYAVGGDGSKEAKAAQQGDPNEPLDTKARRLIIQAGELLRSGHVPEAEDLYRQALALAEKFDPEGIGLAGPLLGMAACEERNKHLSEAEELIRRSLAIGEKKLGPKNPELMGPLNQLAGLLLAGNRPTEADRILRRVLEIAISNNATSNLEYTRAMNTLAFGLVKRNQFADALPIQRKIVDTVELTLGKDNETYGEALHNVGTTLARLERTDEAIHTLEQAVAVSDRLKPAKPRASIWLSDLAMVHFHIHEMATAEPLFRRSVAQLTHLAETTGQEPPELATCVKSYQIFLQGTSGLTPDQINDRLARLRRGEDVPALPTLSNSPPAAAH